MTVNGHALLTCMGLTKRLSVRLMDVDCDEAVDGRSTDMVAVRSRKLTDIHRSGAVNG
jgi:hypothetical protein